MSRLRAVVLFTAVVSLLCRGTIATESGCSLLAEGSFLARVAPHVQYASLLEMGINGNSFASDGSVQGFYDVGDINRMLIVGRQLFFAGNFQYLSNGVQSNSVARANLDSFVIGGMGEGVWNDQYLPTAPSAVNSTLASIFLEGWRHYVVVAGHISVPAFETGERSYLALYDSGLGSWWRFPTEEGLCPEDITCQVLGLASYEEDLYIAIMHQAEDSIFQTHLLMYNDQNGQWVEAGPVPTSTYEHDRGNVVRIAYDSLVATEDKVYALGYAASTSDPNPFDDYVQFYTLAWSRADFTSVPLYSSLWLRYCSGRHRSMPAIISWVDGSILVAHAHSSCQGRMGFTVLDSRLNPIDDTAPDTLNSIESALFMVGDAEQQVVAVSDGSSTYAWIGTSWKHVQWGRSGVIRGLVYDHEKQNVYGSFSPASIVDQQGVQVWEVQSNLANGQPFFVNGVFKNGAVTSAVPRGTGLLVGGDFQYVGTVPAAIAALWDGSHWQRTTVTATGFEGDVATLLAGDNYYVFGLVFNKYAPVTRGSPVPAVLWLAASGWANLPSRPTCGQSVCSPENFRDILYDAAHQKVYFAGDFTVSLSNGITARGLVVFDFALLQWSTLDSVELDRVNSLELINNGMYLAIGGEFQASIGGVSCTNLAIYDVLNGHWVNELTVSARTTEVLDLAAYPGASKVVVAGTLPSNNGRSYGVGVLDYVHGTWDLDSDLPAPVVSVVAAPTGEVFAATTSVESPLKTQSSLLHAWTDVIPNEQGVYWKGVVTHLDIWCPVQASPTPRPSRTAQSSRSAGAGSAGEPLSESVYYAVLSSDYWTNCTDDAVNGTERYYRCHVAGPIVLTTMAYVGLAIAAVATVAFVGVVLVFVYVRKKEEKTDSDEDFIL